MKKKQHICIKRVVYKKPCCIVYYYFSKFCHIKWNVSEPLLLAMADFFLQLNKELPCCLNSYFFEALNTCVTIWWVPFAFMTNEKSKVR